MEVLAGYGVLAAPTAASMIRFETHAHVSETYIDGAVVAFSDIYATRPMALFAAQLKSLALTEAVILHNELCR
jgi:hypothetical protein